MNAAPIVLHIQPHHGGGAETYIDLLERIDGTRHERVVLAGARRPLAAGPSIVARWPGVAARARGADLVHLHGDVASLLSAPFVVADRTVWSTHGLHFTRRHPRAAPLLRAVVARTAVTICSSEAERAEVAAAAGETAAGRLVVVRNGMPAPPAPVPAERRAARTELGIADAELCVLYVAELEPRKDPGSTVEAVALARAAGVPAVLLLVGDGPLRAALSERPPDGVRVLGYRTDLRRLWSAADVFVLPSWREGMSLALLEAMAYGLPAIVASAPGNVEALGPAGVVVPPRDPGAQAAALARLHDPAERRRLGDAARARHAELFGVERFLAEMRAVYGRVRER